MSLIIRNDQITQIENAQLDAFARKLAGELRRDHPEKVLQYDDDQLMEKVLAGIQRAEKYFLSSDSDVEIFVKLLFTISQAYDHYPKFLKLLTDVEADSHSKIPELFEIATEEDWEKASEMSIDSLEPNDE